MATIADNVTEMAIAANTIPTTAPVLIPELEESTSPAETINCLRTTANKHWRMSMYYGVQVSVVLRLELLTETSFCNLPSL